MPVTACGAPVQVDAASCDHSKDAIVGQSRLMQGVYKKIGRVSQTDATVLIRGGIWYGKRAGGQGGIPAQYSFG